MKGTLLTPNLCRLWSVPHLGSTCTTGCNGGRGEVSVCFLLVIVEVNGRRGMSRLRKQKMEYLVSLCASSPFLCHPLMPPCSLLSLSDSVLLCLTSYLSKISLWLLFPSATCPLKSDPITALLSLMSLFTSSSILLSLLTGIQTVGHMHRQHSTSPFSTSSFKLMILSEALHLYNTIHIVFLCE